MADKPTEHRIIEGGEHWIAFAQSEVRRLRTTGLAHVSKRLVMPDDATVFVRIEPGHDHIHIKGTDGNLPMDSGVVDVGSILEAVPASYVAGTLLETTYAARYQAPFTLRNGEPPRLKARNGVNDGQFAGIVKALGKSFTGQVPIDRHEAKSFRPRTIPDPVDGTKRIEDPKDATMYAKKRCAVLCPPSMFTGKLRLYVQALYGAHLSGNENQLIPFDLVEPGRPALLLQNRYKGNGGGAVLLSTGNGLHLDKTTGRHWLFSFTSGMRAFKMIAPESVEALRGWLIDPPNDDHPDKKHPLSEEDREHLEAYILSQCLPYGSLVDASPWVTPESGAVSDPDCMGYSWHWNWSGTAAIARVNTVYEQSLYASAMETRTFEVEVRKVGDDLFSVMQSFSESPLRWSANRGLWVVAEPEWSTLTLKKTTPNKSDLFACSATFYSYFKRDELVNCGIIVTYQPGEKGAVSFFQANNGVAAGKNCWTIGTQEGSRTENLEDPPYFSARAYCGPVMTTELPTGRRTTKYVIEVKNKSFGDWGAGYGGSGYGNWSQRVSDDDGSNEHYVVFNGALNDRDQVRGITFDTSVSEILTREVGSFIAVVPVYDSEAIYLKALATRTDDMNSNVTYHLYNNPFGTPGAFLVRTYYTTDGIDRIYLGYAAACGAFAADYHSLASSEPIMADPTEVATYTFEGLICKAESVIPATFTHVSEFFSNEDTVGTGFYTKSGTRLAPDGVAIATPLIKPHQAPDTTVPVLVGWV